MVLMFRWNLIIEICDLQCISSLFWDFECWSPIQSGAWFCFLQHIFSLFWILGAGVQFGLVNDFVFLHALRCSLSLSGRMMSVSFWKQSERRSLTSLILMTVLFENKVKEEDDGPWMHVDPVIGAAIQRCHQSCRSDPSNSKLLYEWSYRD